MIYEPIPNYKILKMQLEGISGCIEKYTSESMITSTRLTMLEALESKDAETLLCTCEELVRWYRNNIDSIASNRLVTNLATHNGNIGRLSNIISVIRDHPEWFDTNSGDADPGLSLACPQKKKVVFISHSSLDSEYVKPLVELIRKLGFTKNELFCSSYPGYNIPLGLDIFGFLKTCFEQYDLFVIFMISEEHYYNSPASLNEMGAAWVQGAKSIPILLPGMKPSELRGVVNSNTLALVLDSNDAKFRLNDLKTDLLAFFGKELDSENAWEQDRDSFLEQCKGVAS